MNCVWQPNWREEDLCEGCGYLVNNFLYSVFDIWYLVQYRDLFASCHKLLEYFLDHRFLLAIPIVMQTLFVFFSNDPATWPPYLGPCHYHNFHYRYGDRYYPLNDQRVGNRVVLVTEILNLVYSIVDYSK